MKILVFLAALCLGVGSAAVGEHVKVYDKIDDLLKSGKVEDFKKAEKIVQDALQMVFVVTLFYILGSYIRPWIS